MRRTDQIYTLPNALTLARLPLAGMIWVAPGNRLWLLAILALAGATDVLDGRIARAARRRRLARGEDPAGLDEANAIGAWFDPLCDKLFVASAVTAIVTAYKAPMFELALILTREIVISIFVLAFVLTPRLRRRVQLDFRARPIGKAATVVQFAAVAAIAFWPLAAPYLAGSAALVGAAAAAFYVSRAVAPVIRTRATRPS